MGLLSDRVVLVTGTSSGIGKAAALCFAREGAIVIAAARRADRGEALVSQVKEMGGTIHFVQTDIADESSIDRLFDIIEQDHGRLDAAFNNAGVEAGAALLPETSVETHHHLYGTNVLGTWLCMRHEMRMMMAAKRGAIVNNSSMAGVRGLPFSSVYVGSKHAVVGITRSAALDVAEMGVRVNCLCPGGVRSEMSHRWVRRLSGGETELSAQIPMKRLAQADEIANIALFLLSDMSSYITGAVIQADGGLSAA